MEDARLFSEPLDNMKMKFIFFLMFLDCYVFFLNLCVWTPCAYGTHRGRRRRQIPWD